MLLASSALLPCRYKDFKQVSGVQRSSTEHRQIIMQQSTCVLHASLVPECQQHQFDEGNSLKVTAVVRNTFIHLIADSPNSSFGQAQPRQTQSCPGTNHLPCAVPLGSYGQGSFNTELMSKLLALEEVESLPISECGRTLPPTGTAPPSPSEKPAQPLPLPVDTAPPSPRVGHALAGLEDGAMRKKPWSEELTATLVSAAAAAFEKCSSQKSSPAVTLASHTLLRSIGHDIVDTAVPSDADETSSQDEAVDYPACKTPSPWQSLNGNAAGGDYPVCKTPSPWPSVNGNTAGYFQQGAQVPAEDRVVSNFPRPCLGDQMAVAGQSAPAAAQGIVCAPGQILLAAAQPAQQPPVPQLEAFVSRWGLDQKCADTISRLPVHVQNEIVENFHASAQTRDTSAKFMSWLSSRMRSQEELQACLATSAEERKAFYALWNIDRKCRQMVEDQPAYVQRELINNFKPPPGTMNVSGKMTAFLKRLRSKTDQRQNHDSTVVTSPEVDQFIAHWGLDGGAAQALRRLPKDVRQAVMVGFNPSGRTQSVNGKFISYLQSVVAHGPNQCMMPLQGQVPAPFPHPGCMPHPFFQACAFGAC
eukprot:gb/GFBE01030863.1/.p1 GENE.gb/GFBE01030863.1/~~gb/GFBE01030863.1/.p1  ORF type:complete len:588 (+),score=97.15 gb/GFBE01030863.1/:1-1764(+)